MFKNIKDIILEWSLDLAVDVKSNRYILLD